jgi:hypothetical protein
MMSSRFALAASVALLFLVGCGGSQPMTASTAAQPATRSSGQPFRGYYAAKFTDVVGGALPFSSLCLRFTPSGLGSGYKWSSVPPNSFDNGTYLISGDDLFASAQAPWSPTIYATLQAAIDGTQASGDYIVMQPNGYLYSGGTFIMTRVGKKHC